MRNSRHDYRLFVRGKGGREREVPVPLAVRQALEAWLKVHPLARGAHPDRAPREKKAEEAEVQVLRLGDVALAAQPSGRGVCLCSCSSAIRFG